MGFLSYLFYPWSLVLQAVAILHFIKRRPQSYWIYIIVFLGPLGAIIYLVVEAGPDIVFAGQSFSGTTRRKRVAELEATVRDNPSAGNYEELGGVYMEGGSFELARAAFDKAIAARGDLQDSYYRRGLCALKMGDAAAAIPDLERVVGQEPGYDFHRGAGLLAHACAQAGQKEKAEALFRKAILSSTLSETYLNFAELLASEGRIAEAHQWAQKVLDKEVTMPSYLRRRERPWFQNAREVLKRLPA